MATKKTAGKKKAVAAKKPAAAKKSAAKPAATKKTTKAAKSAEEVLTPESQLKASEKPVAAAVAKGQAGQSYRLLISPRVSRHFGEQQCLRVQRSGHGREDRDRARRPRFVRRHGYRYPDRPRHRQAFDTRTSRRRAQPLEKSVCHR